MTFARAARKSPAKSSRRVVSGVEPGNARLVYPATLVSRPDDGAPGTPSPSLLRFDAAPETLYPVRFAHSAPVSGFVGRESPCLFERRVREGGDSGEEGAQPQVVQRRGQPSIGLGRAEAAAGPDDSERMEECAPGIPLSVQGLASMNADWTAVHRFRSSKS